MLFFNYFILLLAGISFSKEPLIEHRVNGFAQGTTYHITYYSRDAVLKEKIDSILISIDSSLSLYKPYSTISRFNNSEKGLIVDTHLKKVFKKSSEVFYESNGISDITVATLVDIWGFGLHKTKAQPDSTLIKHALECTGFEKLQLRQNDFLSKSLPCVKIDMNGIAQGYTVDILADYFDKKNIKNYLIELGGEIKSRGKKQPSKQNWLVEIENPGNDGSRKRLLTLKNLAITTSGNYRNYLTFGGKKYSHILDPATGYPVENEIISATVIAKDAMTADAYDNVLLSMGIDKGIKYAQSKKHFEAYFIYHKKNGEVADTATRDFNKYYPLLKLP